MKTTALPPPTTTSPATGVHLPVSGGATTQQYFTGVSDALARAGLLQPMAGKRGQVALDAASSRALVQVPEVAADPGRFVKEAFLGSSGIVFNFTPSPGALAPLAQALGKQGEGETFALFRGEMLQYAANRSQLERLALDSALTEAFALGKTGTTATSQGSTFRPGSAPWAPPTVAPATPQVSSSPLGQLLEGASFGTYAQPTDDQGTLTLATKGGQRATVLLTADVFGDGAVSARFSEPGPIPTSAEASQQDLSALLKWFDGADPGNNSLTRMMSALREQLSAG